MYSRSIDANNCLEINYFLSGFCVPTLKSRTESQIDFYSFAVCIVIMRFSNEIRRIYY